MENELYKMMINNAREHLKQQNPELPKEDDFNIFKISEILALCLCKSKEDIIMDIIKPKESKQTMENKIFTTADSDDAVYNLVIELKIPMSKSNNIIMYPVTKEFTYMLSEKQYEVIQKLYKENCIGGERGYTWKLIEIKQ